MPAAEPDAGVWVRRDESVRGRPRDRGPCPDSVAVSVPDAVAAADAVPAAGVWVLRIGSVRHRLRDRGPCPTTGNRPRNGRGSVRHGALDSPLHRPAVTFGARRASAPARRPAVACGVQSTRSITATAGRLDGLLGGRDALLRHANPGGAPHGIVPVETRTQSAQYRVLHARRCARSRAQRATRFSCPAPLEKVHNGEALRLGPTGCGASHLAGRVSFPGTSLLLQR
jgi:hypothetical protein